MRGSGDKNVDFSYAQKKKKKNVALVYKNDSY